MLVFPTLSLRGGPARLGYLNSEKEFIQKNILASLAGPAFCHFVFVKRTNRPRDSRETRGLKRKVFARLAVLCCIFPIKMHLGTLFYHKNQRFLGVCANVCARSTSCFPFLSTIQVITWMDLCRHSYILASFHFTPADFLRKDLGLLCSRWPFFDGCTTGREAPVVM